MPGKAFLPCPNREGVSQGFTRQERARDADHPLQCAHSLDDISPSTTALRTPQPNRLSILTALGTESPTKEPGVGGHNLIQPMENLGKEAERRRWRVGWREKSVKCG